MPNPLKDFLTKSPLSVMLGVESRLPILPRMSKLLFGLVDALPDFGSPKLGPRSVEEVRPPLVAPTMGIGGEAEVKAPAPLGKEPPGGAPQGELGGAVAEFFFE